MRRATSTRPRFVRVLEQFYIPGHALHEKGLRIQKGEGPLGRSQERRAAIVLRMNRESNGHHVAPFDFKIAGHTLHEKGLQRQIGVSTVASSQERRAAVVLQTNRG